MKKNDTVKTDVNVNKVSLQIEKIKTNLNNASEGKISNLTNKMRLVEDFSQLHKLGGLKLSDYFNHFNINHLKSYEFATKPYHQVYF